MKKKNAFTLAEVLITLTVLGVIAVIVVPNIIRNYNERITVAKVKKIYSTLNDAAAQAQIIDGPVTSWDIGEYNTKAGAEKIYKYLSPNFQVSKYCGTAKSGDCFASEYKTLKGKYTTPWPIGASDKFCKFILKDGTHIAFWSAGKANCTSDSKGCISVMLDINGKKGPNRAGIDLFEIYISGNTDLRYKGNYSSCSLEDKVNYNGQSCAYWIINKGNMDYLRRDISNN